MGTMDFGGLRKLLHRKSPEILAPLPLLTIAAGFICADKSDMVPGHLQAFYIGGVSVIWRYSSDEDCWLGVPNSGIAGTFGAGSCGEFRAMSAPGGVQNITATGGSTTTLSTSLTLAMSLKGCKVRAIAGPGAGYEGTITDNTLGANGILTVSVASGVAFTAATVFNLFAGALWFLNAGTPGFAVYDLATNAWTQRSVTGLPAWAVEGQLVGTGSAASNEGLGFVNGTASAGGASTLTDAAKAWPVNGWANFQVRIKSGTGAGQVRSIASNTATVLTVSAAWTTNPDATSIYVIEGNDDYLYLAGNNVVTLYRYAISANTWATLAPVAARPGGLSAGGSLDWIDGVPDWQEAAASIYGAHYGTIIHQNGRYLYSFRGGATSILDVYDIAANTWISTIPYGGQFETFTTGSCAVDIAGQIYIQKEATGRVFKFDVAQHRLDPFFVSPIPQSTVLLGDKMMIQTYRDATSVGRYLYSLAHTSANFIRVFLV